MKKRICWITPDYFVDVDIPIIPFLLNKFDIHWIIVFRVENRFKISDFNYLRDKYSNLSIDFHYLNHRFRDVRIFFDYIKLQRMVKSINADIIYINVVPSNPFIVPFFWSLPREKTIATAHDGSIKSIMKFGKIVLWSFKQAYGSVKYVNMFSLSQAKLFAENFPGNDITIIPLALKDYGKPTIVKRTDCISFVSFGTIHAEKNIGLLIEAANQLYEEGTRGFKVSINGLWRENWNINTKIRHPEIFEVSLGVIPNKLIPNLFGYNHYAVFPYKQMSQSGAIKVAYNYNNPVITSNLQGFIDEVEENVDGFIFRSEDLISLKFIMKKCIEEGVEGYNEIVTKMRKHIDETYATPIIIAAYQKMFEKIK